LLHCEAQVGAALEGFEVIPAASLAAVLAYLPAARSPLEGHHAWHVLIEVVADEGGADGLREQAEAMVASAFEAGLIEDATFSANEAQAEAFWTLRDSVAPSERAKGPALQHDISVPVERMPDFVDHAIAAIETAYPGVQAVAFGHLGDGNVHFHVIAPPGAERIAWETGIGKKISGAVYDMVSAWGGSISAEHGIGQVKRDEFERLGDPVALMLLKRVKAALDPQQILNPGKLLTLAPPGGAD
jgi:FAD/FMN-containing dehydrogenase